MQLYSLSFSPYAARCRIYIHHKGLPVEIVAPPGGLGSAQLKAKNPTGKIPVLDLGDKALAESWAIMEYLESTNPAKPLWPADEFGRARVRELVRYVDLYLAMSIVPMFRALRGAATPEQVTEALTQQDGQLATLELLLARKDQEFAIKPLDMADAALIPVIYYSILLTRHFGKREALAKFPVTAAWWQRVSAVPAAAKVLGEMEAGLKQAIPVLVEGRSPATA